MFPVTPSILVRYAIDIWRDNEGKDVYTMPRLVDGPVEVDVETPFGQVKYSKYSIRAYNINYDIENFSIYPLEAVLFWPNSELEGVRLLPMYQALGFRSAWLFPRKTSLRPDWLRVSALPDSGYVLFHKDWWDEDVPWVVPNHSYRAFGEVVYNAMTFLPGYRVNGLFIPYEYREAIGKQPVQMRYWQDIAILADGFVARIKENALRRPFRQKYGFSYKALFAQNLYDFLGRKRLTDKYTLEELYKQAIATLQEVSDAA